MAIYVENDIVPLVLQELESDNYVRIGSLYLIKEGDICSVRTELFYHMRSILVCNTEGVVYYFDNDHEIWKDLFNEIGEVITMEDYFNKRFITVRKFKPRMDTRLKPRDKKRP